MITLDLQMDGKSLSLSLRQGEHPRTVADEFCTAYKVTTPDCGGVSLAPSSSACRRS